MACANSGGVEAGTARIGQFFYLLTNSPAFMPLPRQQAAAAKEQRSPCKKRRVVACFGRDARLRNDKAKLKGRGASGGCPYGQPFRMIARRKPLAGSNGEGSRFAGR